MRQLFWGAAQIVVFVAVYVLSYRDMTSDPYYRADATRTALFAAGIVTVVFATMTMWLGIWLSRWRANRARRREQRPDQSIPGRRVLSSGSQFGDPANPRLPRK